MLARIVEMPPWFAVFVMRLRIAQRLPRKFWNLVRSS